jgi:hypothetical protein
MSVSGAVGRAVSTSGVTAVPAAELAEVGVGRAQNFDPNQPEERLGGGSSGFRAGPFIRDWTAAQPETLSSNSTTPPSLRDGLMATPSAGANSIALSVSATAGRPRTTSLLLSIGRLRNTIRRFRLVGSAPNGQNSYTRQSPLNCRVPGNAKNETRGA